jgi:hypothetical protein
MYIVLALNDFNLNNVFFQERIKNTVMDNSNFLRVIYSNELIILNGLFLKFDMNLSSIEKSFNKYKCFFEVKQHADSVSRISALEQDILKRYVFENKKAVHRISEQLNNGFIKIFNEATCKDTNEFILKIYGIWETDLEYGLTYKFINV